ncbi:5-formyltetrahydrofolate cyclo-ligase [Acetobacter syzygii]|uniref:5-formyltetrahydrofolate cyclo-ligase n=1 Tax=Acetobacter syzygii TaxID=146476 RepID=UPI00156EA6ED|nr:5-formyltetrahydrofolate cyclo-ligase [Acetobacter syzygii]NSL93808.1 5-formyltetrahydrofolate cyclo-ligase [Acetobacter syzygii]
MVAPHTPPPCNDPPDVAARKKDLRVHCIAALKAREVTRDQGIIHNLERLLHRSAGPVACVWPLPHEVDLRPLCHKLAEWGIQVTLPQTPPRGTPLVFRQWHPGSTMLAGRFGTHYPDGPVMEPDLVLVPLLGFDRAGHRLGYGGGYYDRTLAALPHATSIGYAPSTQEVGHLPCGPYDQPLSCIVTEKEVIRFD